jgi:hypothetical protein
MCIICHSEMTEGKKLPCNHILHESCLRSWLHRQQRCPICRTSVLEEEIAQNHPPPPRAQPQPQFQPQPLPRIPLQLGNNLDFVNMPGRPPNANIIPDSRVGSMDFSVDEIVVLQLNLIQEQLTSLNDQLQQLRQIVSARALRASPGTSVGENIVNNENPNVDVPHNKSTDNAPSVSEPADTVVEPLSQQEKDLLREAFEENSAENSATEELRKKRLLHFSQN